MRTRRIADFEVSAVGLGCMNISHAYGAPPPPEDGARLLRAALDLGYTFLDTAAFYGHGGNERLIGETLAARRDEFVLASKCGIYIDADGQRRIDGRPSNIRRECEDSLKRLRTEVIDLYYLHRLDRTVPIEDSVGAMAELVAEGKVRALGLSEISAATLRRAHAVHPIAAVQSEYSLWTRNPEIAVLDACRELGVALVAFSPMTRGFLTGMVRSTEALAANDLRKPMPRFKGENFAKNLRLLAEFEAFAREVDLTPATLTLAWVLAQGQDVVPIPGTTQLDHLAENARATEVELDAPTLARLDAMINRHTVSGGRYTDAAQADIDTEEFDA
jgi:aryl-alcohol dehydrogenase-like predicted oxidoreductase